MVGEVLARRSRQATAMFRRGYCASSRRKRIAPNGSSRHVREEFEQMRTTHTRLCAASIALMLFSSLAVAQVSTGTLVGTVLDSSGAGVPNARVEAKNVATGVATSTTATQAGDYRFNNLLAGTYDITGTASGFT